VWFYVTPIIYSIDDIHIPAHYAFIFKLNPIIYVLNGFRLSVYYGMLPTAQSIAASFGCAFVALYLGFRIFRRHQHDFVFYV
jgi:ABC-type polysaccharide/polyol phosphate export permease